MGLNQIVGESNCIWNLFEVLFKYSNRDSKQSVKGVKGVWSLGIWTELEKNMRIINMQVVREKTENLI